MTARTRGKRAVRTGPARRAAGVVIEPRDVGPDRGEQAVEQARVAWSRATLADQRLAVNKRRTSNARDAYRRALENHLVSAHGATRVRSTREEDAHLLLGGEQVWLLAGFLERAHEREHGRA